MPRTLQEILDHADELADRFESEDFGAESEVRDASTLRELSRAVQERAFAEARVAEAVAVARADGSSWSAIGLMLGTSGEAARQRYGGKEGARKARSPEATDEERLADLMAALEASVREAKAARRTSVEAAAKAARSAESVRDLASRRETSKRGRATKSATRKAAQPRRAG